ncbi:MAG: type II toxin-antitoxin system Phd/YefM family antitoxin [Chloroflexi bacterium]|nr:type II toxin-antitoxin system Phd/YefM family antitoxin [Chloroflexota bacterium]
MTRITATELARGLSQILTRVKRKGERFVIDRDGEAIAVLAPAPTPAALGVEEFAAKIGDLEFPGEGFADDLEEVQAAQPLERSPEWPT